MNRNMLAMGIGALALLLVGLGAGYWLAGQRMGMVERGAPPASGAESAGPIANNAGDADGEKADPETDRKVLYWHDPMVPGPKFDKPGKSPFMDMQLVPVYADEGSDQGKVSISSRTLQNLGVRTVEVTQGELEMGFSTVGAVSIDERSITSVQARVNGYIEKLYVRAQYDTVTRGQRLADIYAPDWLSAEEEYLALKQSTLPGADMLAEAARERLKLLGISENQIRAIERDGKADPRVTLYAPESGLVWELGTRDGMAVSPGMTLFKLANLRSVWINAEVPETQAELVKPSAPVEARLAAYPDRSWKGQVAALLPDVNPTTRTIKARVVLSNPDGLLKPGLFATLTFARREQQALMVPTEAVIYTGTRTVVIVSEAGKFKPVEIKVGRDSGDMTEIRTGLEAGQSVVVSGQFLIDSEASLKSTLTRMNETESAPSAAVNAEGSKP